MLSWGYCWSVFRGQGNSPCGYKVSGNARRLREGISGEIRFCGRESRLKCLIVNVLWVFIQHTGYLFDTVYYSYRHRSESCGMNEILFFYLKSVILAESVREVVTW